jgi:PRTRC genetic system ThiF family protein
MIEHTLHPLVAQGRPIQVLVVGAGGNGSAVALWLPLLHQAMMAWGHPHGLHVTLADGDVVTETNCVRQPFSASDVGQNKATVLINRINMFYRLNWAAHPKHLHRDSLKNNHTPLIVIGCVDTRKARQSILHLVSGAGKKTIYWLDLGNNADSGQYVLGQPLNSANPRKGTRLRTVAELYPEIADPSVGEDPLPSCSAQEALERQLY